jgi:hypothetical protein
MAEIARRDLIATAGGFSLSFLGGASLQAQAHPDQGRKTYDLITPKRPITIPIRAKVTRKKGSVQKVTGSYTGDFETGLFTITMSFDPPDNPSAAILKLLAWAGKKTYPRSIDAAQPVFVLAHEDSAGSVEMDFRSEGKITQTFEMTTKAIIMDIDESKCDREMPIPKSPFGMRVFEIVTPRGAGRTVANGWWEVDGKRVPEGYTVDYRLRGAEKLTLPSPIFQEANGMVSYAENYMNYLASARVMPSKKAMALRLVPEG